MLRRGGGTLQVGLEPGTAVVLRGPGVEQLLTRLDGRTELPALRAQALTEGMTRADVDAVLFALGRAGLLVAALPGAPARVEPVGGVSGRRAARGNAWAAVRLAGLGPLGQQLAALLLASGIDVYAAELGPPGPRPGTLPLADLTPADAPNRGDLRLVNHWSKPQDELVRLTVVAADTVEPDRVVTESLMRSDQPHLLLRSAGTTVTVGPLVLPGRTSCLRCTDLARRDLDPGWPVLLPQLTSIRMPTSAVLLAWAAAVAAAQVLAALQDGQPEVAGATLELDLSDHLTRWRAWPQHVGCGCAWAATTDWGP